MGTAVTAAEAVRVEGLEVAAYTIPTDEPESDGTLEWDSTTIVVVEAEAGGETGLGYTYGETAVATLIAAKLRDAVVGTDAMSPPGAWARMQQQIRNAGRPGVGAMAVSSVDVALWDVKARLLGVCLADALPRFHASVPIYGSGGFCSYGDERLAEQLGGWVDEGIPRVKIKVGRDPDRDPDRLGVAREAVGEGTELMVDANGAFDRKGALLWAQRYAAEFGVSYFEEPVSSEDREGLRLLRDRGPAGMAIAAGEYEWDLRGLRELSGCVDVIQADVTRCGGITNLLRAGGIFEAAQLPFSAHCAPAISAHACCSVHTLRHLEYFHDHVRIERMLFDGVLEPDGGELVPDRSRPGLGLELRRADAERYAA
jgi:L-alanine-DL-glutamate epimerase-like enolase superfamily enzyme